MSAGGAASRAQGEAHSPHREGNTNRQYCLLVTTWPLTPGV